MDPHTNCILLSKLSFTLLIRAESVPIRSFVSTCTAIIPYGGSYSSIGIRLNSWVRDITILTPRIRSIILGSLLGDGALVMSRTSINPYFVFTQTIKRYWYTSFMFAELSSLCQKAPTLGGSTRHGVTSYFTQIHTWSYPCLLPWYDSFYPLVNGVRTKVFPILELHYFDALMLAILVMGNRSFTLSGSYIHTKGFTFSDVYRLARVLHYNFGLICIVQSHKGMPVLYITAKSMPLFISVVKPYMHPRFIISLV